jgi:hypothetical protein
VSAPERGRPSSASVPSVSSVPWVPLVLLVLFLKAPRTRAASSLHQSNKAPQRKSPRRNPQGPARQCRRRANRAILSPTRSLPRSGAAAPPNRRNRMKDLPFRPPINPPRPLGKKMALFRNPGGPALRPSPSTRAAPRSAAPNGAAPRADGRISKMPRATRNSLKSRRDDTIEAVDVSPRSASYSWRVP